MVYSVIEGVKIKKYYSLIFLIFFYLLLYIILFCLNDGEANNSDIKQSNNKIKIAILDSGINKNVDKVKDKVVKQYNAINPKKKVYDDYDHGTAVAGIIISNNPSRLGDSPNAELYDVKVLDKNGKGEISSLIKAINWCIKENISIINISFGVQIDNKDLKNSIQKALDSGIIIIASAGNTYGTGVDYPAQYKGVLSINALNSNIKTADFSAKGKIDYSMVGVDLPSINHYGESGLFSGTSFATAYATRVISVLLLKQNKHITSSNIHSFLNSHTTRLGKKDIDEYYGYGILNTH
ncbi:S8 family serine peptidase [Bacillus swezeyi]|uniref:S8 family serine peptidase n=1 Tax=Bacillus swezeyi TaxID=1925020 RepID=UPI002E207DF9|nr:S8 family serine peptidase [Bacillus swezeyi]